MIVDSGDRAYSVLLLDDGTMDTVISVDGIEHRFDGDYASEYRDEDGAMTVEGLEALGRDAIEADERHWD